MKSRHCKQCKSNYVSDRSLIGKKFRKNLTGDFSQSLRMPEKFMSHFQGELPQAVYLKGLGGYPWRIGLVESEEGEVFLRNAWKDFLDAHNLKDDDTLIFEYEGDYCFSVSMFDASHECEKESADYVNFSTEVSDSDAPPPNEKHRISPSTSHGVPTPANEEDRSDDDDDEVSTPNPESGTKSARESSPVEGGLGPGNSRDETRKEDVPYSIDRLVTEEGRNKARELADAFRPSGPSFVSLMTDYSINASFLTIPTEFARKYLPQTDTNITLRLPSGQKEWTTRYLVTKRKILRFGSNWRGFAIDNSLVAGDVCVFELSGLKIITAHIFRA